MPALTAGAAVTLRCSPRRSLPIAGQQATVRAVHTERVGGRDIAFAKIEMADGMTVDDVPLAYLDAVKEPPKRRGALHMREPKDERTEAQRQNDGVKHLRNQGYIVLEIGKSRKGFPCKHCGGFVVPTGWQGNDPGAPDTIVTHDDWPAATWLALEWKDGPRGERQPEQIELERRRRIVVVWDTPGAVAAVEAFEAEVMPKRYRDDAAEEAQRG